MAIRYLLDTDICIYLHRKQPPSVAVRFAKLSPGDAAISVITYGELAFGACKNPNPQSGLSKLDFMTALVPVLPFPEEGGRIYGRIRAELERQGQGIGGNDLWIAAHAMAAGLTLVTNNEREFRRVKGLKFENWAK
jgi:tRNA(fMet)-specific endonuclease VapC